MAKRTARSDLNADNWDHDEEEEEAGEFKQANDNVLASRVIRKAKRRGTDSGTPDEGAPKAFAGFAGFSAKPSGTTAPLSGFFNGSTSSTASTTTTPSIFSGLTTTGAPSFSMSSSAKTSPSPGIFGGSSLSSATDKPTSNGHSTEGKGSSRSKYLSQLKALNESVTKWIQNHVEKNPYCILTPIFKDYEKHLDEINKKFPEESKAGEEVGKDEGKRAESKMEEKEKSSSSSEGESDKESSSKPAETKPSFSFGSLSSDTKASTAPTSGFKFGSLGGSTGTGFSGFSSLGGASSTGASSGFSFAVSKPPAAQSADAAKGGDDDEYVPPKPESSTVTEEDATYTKKCKLFYKKDGGWAERGLGNLYLKPSGEKTQLLVRADTTLGNILLNIIIGSSIPVSRQGKNNVALICIPNPPIDEKKGDDSGDAKEPVSMLIKVKTAEDADELVDKLNEAKS